MIGVYLLAAFAAAWCIAEALMNTGVSKPESVVAATILGLVWPTTVIYFLLALFARAVSDD